MRLLQTDVLRFRGDEEQQQEQPGRGQRAPSAERSELQQEVRMKAMRKTAPMPRKAFPSASRTALASAKRSFFVPEKRRRQYSALVSSAVAMTSL